MNKSIMNIMNNESDTGELLLLPNVMNKYAAFTKNVELFF